MTPARRVPLRALGLAAVATLACAGGPELTRRYAEVRPVAAPADAEVSVSVFSVAAPPAGSRSMFDLGSSAQTAFLNVARDRTETMSEFAEALAVRVPAETGMQAIDVTTVRRRVVFSIVANGFGPADRLDRLRISLKLQPDRPGGPPAWRFTNWDRFSTRYETVDLGDLTLSKEDAFEIALNGAQPLAGRGEVDAAAGRSRELRERVELSRRYVAATGVLSAEAAAIHMEGAVGIDLTGNAIIDLELESREVSPPLLAAVTSGLDAGSPAAAQITWIDVRWPPGDSGCGASDVVATLEARYRVRRVLSGSHTVVESDDVIDFVEGTRTFGEVVLVPARDQRLTLWELSAGAGPVLTLDRAPLLFPTAGDARSLAAWIRKTGATSIGATPLMLGEQALSELARDGRPALDVRPHRVNWNCDGGS